MRSRCIAFPYALLVGMVLQSIFFLQALNAFAVEKQTVPVETVQASVLREAIPNSAVVGHGVLFYAFWDIYEATLFAPGGVWDAKQPHALSIEYFRALNGKAIADRSVQEIRQQGFTDEVMLAAWHAQMKAIFPDVKKGTVLTAVYIPDMHTSFYSGTEVIGVIKDDAFGKAFFGIWLAEKTSEPTLRRALLGLQ